ncbi:hypothetical protein BC831DRAFT_554099 [Entophlyctis helioformis]|nr:hypothetical protein BC831DRAFT_554099 [Entophlyctis helioformis]
MIIVGVWCNIIRRRVQRDQGRARACCASAEYKSWPAVARCAHLNTTTTNSLSTHTHNHAARRRPSLVGRQHRHAGPRSVASASTDPAVQGGGRRVARSAGQPHALPHAHRTRPHVLLVQPHQPRHGRMDPHDDIRTPLPDRPPHPGRHIQRQPVHPRARLGTRRRRLAGVWSRDRHVGRPHIRQRPAVRSVQRHRGHCRQPHRLFRQDGVCHPHVHQERPCQPARPVRSRQGRPCA